MHAREPRLGLPQAYARVGAAAEVGVGRKRVEEGRKADTIEEVYPQREIKKRDGRVGRCAETISRSFSDPTTEHQPEKDFSRGGRVVEGRRRRVCLKACKGGSIHQEAGWGLVCSLSPLEATQDEVLVAARQTVFERWRVVALLRKSDHKPASI